MIADDLFPNLKTNLSRDEIIFHAELYSYSLAPGAESRGYFCPRSCMTRLSKYVLMSLGRSQEDGLPLFIVGSLVCR